MLNLTAVIYHNSDSPTLDNRFLKLWTGYAPDCFKSGLAYLCLNFDNHIDTESKRLMENEVLGGIKFLFYVSLTIPG